MNRSWSAADETHTGSEVSFKPLLESQRGLKSVLNSGLTFDLRLLGRGANVFDGNRRKVPVADRTR
jgi:hypothetical protein